MDIRPGIPRWLDAALAGAALAVATPILAAAAVAVKLTSAGPALFKQERVGRHGRSFRLIKLRTMRPNHKRLQVTAGNDPLITPVGRFLRKSKLDELPSLWNVVRGDLSLVGPRPEVPSLVDLSDPLWAETLLARPGITDSVTLRLRNEEALMTQAQARLGDMERFYRDSLQRWKLREYVRYLRRRSFGSDMRVLMDTLLAIVGWSPGGPPTMEEITAAGGDSAASGGGGFRWWPGSLGRRAQIVVDGLVVACSLVLAYLLRFDFILDSHHLRSLAVQVPAVVLIHAGAVRLLGAQRIIWRYVSLVDLGRFGMAVVSAAAVLLAIRLLPAPWLQGLKLPLSVLAINAILAFMGLTGIRVLRRLVFEHWERRKVVRPGPVTSRRPILLVGAGQAGILAAREMLARSDGSIEVKGFVDDDPAKAGSLVHGIKVLGTTGALPRLVAELGINHVVITINGATAAEIARIVQTCQAIPVEVRAIPRLREVLQGLPAPVAPRAPER